MRRPIVALPLGERDELRRGGGALTRPAAQDVEDAGPRSPRREEPNLA
jgi:hypothetical protein